MVAESLLASWSDTETRQAVVDFVDRVTTEGGSDHVVPHERIAVFDNDGTLWPEKPIPIQLDFSLFRMAELVAADASLAGRQPYRAAADRDYGWLGQAMVQHHHGEDGDLRLLMAAVQSAFGGMTVESFGDEALAWLQDATHPQLQRPYLTCRSCRWWSS